MSPTQLVLRLRSLVSHHGERADHDLDDGGHSVAGAFEPATSVAWSRMTGR
jgi:hypothetical protein